MRSSSPRLSRHGGHPATPGANDTAIPSPAPSSEGTVPSKGTAAAAELTSTLAGAPGADVSVDEQEAAIATAFLNMEMRRSVVLDETTPDANGHVPTGKLTDVIDVSGRKRKAAGMLHPPSSPPHTPILNHPSTKPAAWRPTGSCAGKFCRNRCGGGWPGLC